MIVILTDGATQVILSPWKPSTENLDNVYVTLVRQRDGRKSSLLSRWG